MTQVRYSDLVTTHTAGTNGIHVCTVGRIHTKDTPQSAEVTAGYSCTLFFPNNLPPVLIWVNYKHITIEKPERFGPYVTLADKLQYAQNFVTSNDKHTVS